MLPALHWMKWLYPLLSLTVWLFEERTVWWPLLVAVEADSWSTNTSINDSGLNRRCHNSKNVQNWALKSLSILSWWFLATCSASLLCRIPQAETGCHSHFGQRVWFVVSRKTSKIRCWVWNLLKLRGKGKDFEGKYVWNHHLGIQQWLSSLGLWNCCVSNLIISKLMLPECWKKSSQNHPKVLQCQMAGYLCYERNPYTPFITQISPSILRPPLTAESWSSFRARRAHCISASSLMTQWA